MSEGTGISPQAYRHAPFLRPLASLSAVMGRDLVQVQGPGGNSSLKHQGVLWVKASGTDLADAAAACIFVPVELEAARYAARAGKERPVMLPKGPQAERPSIEWSLHALMPHPIVLHSHDVNVIVWAVRRDAEAALAEPMQGLNWAFVPYARPGLPLTRRVRDVLETRTPDILVLGNHGLVVGANSPEAAGRLLAAVRKRLDCAPRCRQEADRARLDALARGTPFEPAMLPEAHWTALDETALKVATGGVLYPDHAVFLGTEATIVPCDGPDLLRRTKARLAVVPGAGVLIGKGAPAAAQAMAACLGMVASRFPADASPAYLGPKDISALLGWDAERYRQELARRRTADRRG